MACQPRAGELAVGFAKADARNLPRVDIMMIVNFFQQDRHPAMKHSKMQRLVGVRVGVRVLRSASMNVFYPLFMKWPEVKDFYKSARKHPANLGGGR